jgi:hypothetical protein
MRKIILICFALVIGLIAFGQPIVNRAGASNTVSDARWQAQLNAFLPRYNDTTQLIFKKELIQQELKFIHVILKLFGIEPQILKDGYER